MVSFSLFTYCFGFTFVLVMVRCYLQICVVFDICSASNSVARL